MEILAIILLATTVTFFVLWLAERRRNDPRRREIHPEARPQQRPQPYAQQQADSQLPPYVYAQQPYPPPSYPYAQQPYEQPYQQPPQPPYGQALDPYQPYNYAQPQPPYPPPYPVKPLRTKEETHLRNLNVILYVAGFLIVAGSATVIGAISNPWTRLLILLGITALFYAAGIILHVRTERLRAAATAFAGTGLAIIPFTGIAFYYLADIPGAVCWLITSVIGLAANIVATYVLRNQVVSFCVIAFVLSLACSLTAMVGVAFTWYFAVLILVSILFSLLVRIMPLAALSVFQKPMELMGKIVTPTALIASLAVFVYAESPLYSVVFALATVHYVIVFLQTKKPGYEIIARILAQISVIIIVYDICDGLGWLFVRLPEWFGILEVHVLEVCLFVTLAAQMLFSLWRAKRSEKPNAYLSQIPWMATMSGVAGIAILLWEMAYDRWNGDDVFSLIVFCFLGVYFAFAARVFRQINFAYGTLAASIGAIVVIFTLSAAIPLLALIDPFLYDWIDQAQTGAPALLVLSALLLLYYRKSKGKAGRTTSIFLKTAFFTYLSFAIFFGVFLLLLVGEGQHRIDLGFDAVISIVSAVLLLIFSNLEKKLSAVIASAALLFFGLFCLIGECLQTSPVNSNYNGGLEAIVFAAACFVVYGACAVIFRKRTEWGRVNICVIAISAAMFRLVDARLIHTEILIAGAALPLAASVVFVAASLLFHKTSRSFRIISLICSLTCALVAAVIADAISPLLCGAVFVYIATMSYIVSRRNKVQWLDFLTVCAVAAAAAVLQEKHFFRPESADANFLTAVITATATYVLYWVCLKKQPVDKIRHAIFFLSAEISLVIGAFAYVVPPALAAALPSLAQSLGSITSLLAMGIITGVCGHLRPRRVVLKEVGLYLIAAAGIWYLSVLLPEANLAVIFVHIVAAVVVVSALWLQPDGRGRQIRFLIATAILTVGLGAAAIIDAGFYQILFLAETLILLVIGAVRGKQWAVWWGAAGAGAAILYFLSSYVWLLLLFLGICLITFVIWRLLQIGKKK